MHHPRAIDNIRLICLSILNTMSTLRFSPIAPESSQIRGDHYRLTIITDGLIRYEWSEDGEFEDRASTFAISRDQPTPTFHKMETEAGIEILTSRLHLEYDKKEFSPSGFTVLLNQKRELFRAIPGIAG